MPLKLFPKSQVMGVVVWMNMPYPRLLIKKGMGLYKPWFSMPLASSVQSTIFWPRLSSAVKDSPHPNIFSSGARVKAAL